MNPTERLLESLKPLILWWIMTEECNALAKRDDFKDEQVVLSFMGCGSSTNVTVGQIREILNAERDVRGKL